MCFDLDQTSQSDPNQNTPLQIIRPLCTVQLTYLRSGPYIYIRKGTLSFRMDFQFSHANPTSHSMPQTAQPQTVLRLSSCPGGMTLKHWPQAYPHVLERWLHNTDLRTIPMSWRDDSTTLSWGLSPCPGRMTLQHWAEDYPNVLEGWLSNTELKTITMSWSNDCTTMSYRL